MIDYDLDDDEDCIDEFIFGKSITQEERMQADLKDHTLEEQCMRQRLYYAGKRAALACSQDIRQQQETP